MTHSLVYTLSLIVLCVGGINWGLVGVFDFDLVARIFGHKTVVSKTIYTLVGLAAIHVMIATVVFHNMDMLT